MVARGGVLLKFVAVNNYCSDTFVCSFHSLRERYGLDSQATPFSLIGRGWEKRDW